MLRRDELDVEAGRGLRVYEAGEADLQHLVEVLEVREGGLVSRRGAGPLCLEEVERDARHVPEDLR